MNNPATSAGLTGRGLKIGAGPGETLEAVANFRLEEAWRALQAEFRTRGVNLTTQVTAGTVSAADIADVICQSVMRVLRNPQGAEEESASIDDYRENVKHADATQDIYFTAAELRRLTPANTVTPTAGSMKYS